MTNHAELGDWLDERQERFIAIANDIWMRPELALAETYACGRQADDLAADGFTIARNVGDLPTAFTAEWGSGAPVIGFLGEYDALPNLSQRAESGQGQALAGGAGHGCGHNLLGTASLAAASAVKAWLEETGQPGTVRYYGCPAEEIGAGKVFMARAGAFDGLDAAITWHPGEKNTVWGASSLAIAHIKFRFHGQTAHAAGNPELGRSSLDAVELTNIGVNFMREHIIEQARIHYVITNGGGAPNVVPDDAEVWYFIRAPHRAQVEELTAWVRKIARGAAMMTETRLEEHEIHGLHNYLPNRTLADVAGVALEGLGPIEFTAEEREFAAQVVAGYPEATRAGALSSLNLSPEAVGQSLLSDYFPLNDWGKTLSGSTDVAEVSWMAPTVQVTTACCAPGVPGHSWGITACGGMSIGHKGMLHAAKAMAITAAALHTDPTLLTRAQADYREATGGRPYRAPLEDGIAPPRPRPAKG
jgi:aminobenzoyl-glutamate utilization protein B